MFRRIVNTLISLFRRPFAHLLRQISPYFGWEVNPASPYGSRLQGREIRLITLVDDNSCSDVPSCKFDRVSLDHSPDFDALSYCWGDPALQKDIRVDDQPWNVTEQLDQALRQLRRVCPGRKVWADALCINQGDTAEKNIQVPLMSAIYSQAQHVYIWLGPSNHHLDELVRFMRSGEARKLDPDHHRRFKVLSYSLFSLPWWTRIWTFQEFLLARRPVFLLGDHVIESIEMAAWRSWLPMRTEMDEQHIQARMESVFDRRLNQELIAVYGNDMADMWQKRTKGSLCCMGLMDQIQELTGDGRRQLQILLASTAAREATDPRDSIYALCGLIPDTEQAMIPIDYSATKEQVYHRTICSMWSTWSTLYLEQMCSFRFCGDNAGLNSHHVSPSWVLDYSTNWHGPLGIIFYVMAEKPWIDEQSRLHLSPDCLILGIQATRLCDIELVEGIPDIPERDPVLFTGQVKAIMAALVIAKSRVPDDETNNRLQSLETLRTRELPLLILRSMPKQLMDRTGPGRDLGSQLEQVRQVVVDEFTQRSAANLAQLWQRNPPNGRERGLKGFLDAIAIIRKGMFFFVTKQGFAGLSHMRPAVNDCVILPRGGRMFLILRPAGAGKYRMVGPAYIAGLMDFDEVNEQLDEAVEREELFEVI